MMKLNRWIFVWKNECWRKGIYVGPDSSEVDTYKCREIKNTDYVKGILKIDQH